MKDVERAAQLRLFTDADRAAVKHLLRSVWGADNDVIAYFRYYGEPILRGERYLHTFVAEHGVTTLQAEIDTDDPCMMLLLQHLPFGTSAAWITFRREQ